MSVTVISVNIVHTITPNIYKSKCKCNAIIRHVRMYSVEFFKLVVAKGDGERDRLLNL